MNAPSRKRRTPRITVALRDHVVEAQLLDSAARLAREITAELSGLFLEDIDLLRLAELPLAIEISRTTNLRRPVEAAELARQLASQAAAAERVVARAAEAAGVTWSFSVARGSLTVLLEKAAVEADFTLIPASRRAPWSYADTAAQAPGRRRPSLVSVVLDRSAAGKRALGVSRQLVAAERRPLSVILISANRKSAERLREEAQSALGSQAARFSTLIGTQSARLPEVVRGQSTGLLVVPARRIALVTDRTFALRADLGCAALLVR